MHYYNEIDPVAAEHIENLIFVGAIPHGVVDRRSIEDVKPADLAGYTQCHFFAGIAGWPLALRIAGWPEDRPIWTGSCPCQPFSQAGKGEGTGDPRHLWPAFRRLIAECRPAAVFGEQVASKDVDTWIDAVLFDLEELGYAGGAVAFPSAGVGAPHIRDRTYWMGYADDARLEGLGLRHPAEGGQWQGPIRPTTAAGSPVWLANGNELRLEPRSVAQLRDEEHHAQPRGGSIGVADTDGIARAQGRAVDGGRHTRGDAVSRAGSGSGGDDHAAGPVNGVWRAADWLFGRDGKWRPVEPRTFPLAHGAPARVGRLRAYGNAINPWQAAEFVRAAEEAREMIQ